MELYPTQHGGRLHVSGLGYEIPRTPSPSNGASFKRGLGQVVNSGTVQLVMGLNFIM